MNPKEITYTTELDSLYADNLMKVTTANQFKEFIEKWNYWLDDSCKTLKATDWQEIKPKIDDCRDNTIVPDDDHNLAMALVVPEKLLRISSIAMQFGIPWGCAYIRAKEEALIDF